MDIAASLLGSWSLISWTATSADGEVDHPMGEEAIGWTMYMAGGQMAIHLMERQRTEFASDDLRAEAAERCKEAFLEYFSYCGTFTVQAIAGSCAKCEFNLRKILWLPPPRMSRPHACAQWRKRPLCEQKHLNVITRDYVEYYNKCRPHQGLAQKIPIPSDDPTASGKVVALPVLGGCTMIIAVLPDRNAGG